MQTTRGRALRLALAAVFVAAAGGACRQVIGLDAYDNAPTDASVAPAEASSDAGYDASACGLSFGDASCAACVQASCCTEATQCQQNPPCSNCLGACNGDPACGAQCIAASLAASSYAASTYDPGLAACLATSCAAACNIGGHSCGGLAASLSPASRAAACETCLGQAACSSERACAQSADCQGYVQCLHTCFTPDCRDHCATEHDAGAALFVPVGNAVSSRTCATACGYGQDWSCLGHVQWPAPMASTTDIVFGEVNVALSNGTPVGDAQVSVCGPVGSATCDSPLVSRQTSNQGSVDLPVLTAAAAIGGGGLEPLISISAPGYATSYFDLFFPLSEPLLNFPTGASVLFAQSSATVPPVDAGTAEGGTTPGAGKAGPTAPFYLIAYVLDCQGHPASGVEVTATQLSPCLIPGTPSCPDAAPIQVGMYEPGVTVLGGSGSPFSLTVIPSGFLTLTASVLQPQPVADAGASGPGTGAMSGKLPQPIYCCTPSDLNGPSVQPPPSDDGGPTSPSGPDATLVESPLCPVQLPEGGPAPPYTCTDAGIPCFTIPGMDSGCTPSCSMDPGCIPPPTLPPPPGPPVLLDGGLLGTFSVDVLPGATNIVWIVPQPLPPM